PPPSSLNTAYLLAYNFVSAALWLTVLGKVALNAPSNGASSVKVYAETEKFARLTQSVAGLEVLHSLLGIVRAPMLTTLMQVASRFLLVWGIAYNFPETTQYTLAYSSMLVAWSVTEVVRYTYFVFVIGGFGVPSVITWLRYNTFLVLYPIGVASETWLIYNAIGPASTIDENYGYVLYGVLATYVPGFYVLFTHMLKQRKRILR
ncbi:PTPLA-domain-containing protein, partial [Melanomma pulvis-pyrius CBS 109.77]